MRGLIGLGLLIYGVAHPAAVHGLWHAVALAVGALVHAGGASGAAQGGIPLLGSHWH